jgi:hypothetical protein
VRIAAAKNWFLLFFLPVWLTGWTYGGIMAILQLARTAHRGIEWFLVVWLAGWFWGECLALYVLLWLLFGREIVMIEGGSLSYRRDVFGLGRNRIFPLSDISNLRAAGLYGASARSDRWAFPGLSPGVIAFEYKGKTFRFGPELEEPEAHELVEALRAHLPRRVFREAANSV